MNWKTIRVGILGILVVVNIVLFWLNRLEQDQLYAATDDQLQRVIALYEENEVNLDVLIHRESYPRARILLGDASLLDRSLVEAFLGTEYQTTYMDAQQTRYAKEGETILLDPAHHRMEYTSEQLRWPLWEEETLRSWADVQVSACAGDLGFTCIQESMGEEQAEFLYCQRWNEEYLFMNQILIRIEAEGNAQIIIKYYEPLGYEEMKREIRPIDEMLYAVLREILEERQDDEPIVLTEIRSGYDLEGQEAIYCLEFVLNQGEKTIRMNAYTNERLN